MNYADLNDAETAVALLRSLRGKRVTRVDVETNASTGAPLLAALHLEDGRVVVVDTHGPEGGVLSVYLDSDLRAQSGATRS